MSLLKRPSVDSDTLEQLAGLTGFGWATSVIAFLATFFGYGTAILSRFVTDPVSLLYVGAVFFVATLGLDRLANRDD